jgi:L-cystine uptake protein TcyP (sodium:dicarboxylate symporter family)
MEEYMNQAASGYVVLAASEDKVKKPFYQILYIQVLMAIAIGVALGHFYPTLGTAMKPLGDGFIKLIKMLIAPVVFCTVVTGIAGMQDMKKWAASAARPCCISKSFLRSRLPSA